ncbi:Stp1/IreP family PP2C-type Ser/Thr phosphatase [Candidatus Neptunochlamydia vexilliferae]|uniref:Stp1/IreP family PP2C-type Ser/Thr phosphatase n=1 Tax=Candidatus Neptunichlamydia vexilliferae TaxID=1651774 RepID=UPI0018913A59|nr:Stp1/IreP family PP2C-type Ser/Thr phosphatase [Candidatus Neptunochlamydia vexilliferae]
MNRCAFSLTSYGISDVGLVRKNNEDIFLNMKEHAFFALADGMGGHNAGEIAAKEAVRFVSASIEELFISREKEWDIFDLSSFSKLCIENANSWVHHLGTKKRDYQGMGTTLCTLLFHERSLIYGHVGDSRVYRLRGGTLEQLTLDHSLSNEMLAQGQVSKEELEKLPKNVLTRAIGTQNDVEAEIHIAPVMTNDIYLVCSDGLTDQVSDKEIAEILKNAKDIKSATTQLVERAKQEGGHDNVTVVTIKANEKENLSRQ